mmetsp:Transcript_90902/g.161818  ORF Transcript_90902/g.161818 Transcript_90902/m.161818 type:complete len:250 (-) Transcript_90902:56-805(-)|eukprot:CAMPEP_0197631588 /NCGR_PEP_ID=MMETSP1338-20131121/8710_1 /TAXON_ID=43686 ORGANISM="Pelagodinium beii, Strain RCC1491" /NCGR_SAMPLE_ID=MMETSP1338 /ASSEMBLY_ACC=CAM_ASM_000754 /LENGTH=249 /DNA_ID=CAMNT_0043203085 /DNA_START=97 /DNA_END=846 /DNA_ORIENTATION=-
MGSEAGDGDVALERELEVSNEEGLLSVGSKLHTAGKCKPCAFVHTKGCQNGSSCSFCHECPPQELTRRKRIQRQLLKPRSRAGHRRQGSDASTAASTGSVGVKLGSLVTCATDTSSENDETPAGERLTPEGSSSDPEDLSRNVVPGNVEASGALPKKQRRRRAKHPGQMCQGQYPAEMSMLVLMPVSFEEQHQMPWQTDASWLAEAKNPEQAATHPGQAMWFYQPWQCSEPNAWTASPEELNCCREGQR